MVREILTSIDYYYVHQKNSHKFLKPLLTWCDVLAALEQFEYQATNMVLLAALEEYEGSGTTQKLLCLLYKIIYNETVILIRKLSL